MGTTHLGLQPGALTHGWRDQPDGWIAQQYQNHNAHITKNVPKNQLLVFNVKEGWEPLCEFLECEKPADGTEFPHCKVNDAKALKRMKYTFLTVVYGWIPFVVTVGAAGIYYQWSDRSSSRSSRKY